MAFGVFRTFKKSVCSASRAGLWVSWLLSFEVRCLQGAYKRERAGQDLHLERKLRLVTCALSAMLIFSPRTDHALSAANYHSKNLMFIGVINKRKLLLFSDSLLIRCA